MDLHYSAEDTAFRDEVRTFLEKNYPAALRERVSRDEYTKEDFLGWQKVLFKRGWGAPSWPRQHGGTGWTSTQKYIFQEECARAETLPIPPFGPVMLAPVLMAFANEPQKALYLPRILDGTDFWCQGYSEPGAGSDLASLKTRAEKVDGQWVINGQKTWTTLGHFADWIFVLCRTNPNARKPQEGISFILVDMKAPGVEVRPIITLDGGHEVNEVWFTDVRVPLENLVGAENEGWTYAKFLLVHERSGIAGVARSKKGIERLKEIASIELDRGEPIIRNPDFARKMSELEIDLTALEFTELRTLAREAQGKGAGPESSVLKIKGTEIQQRITELTLEAVGVHGAPYFRGFPMDGDNQFPIGPDYAHYAAPAYANMRKTSIYGGSNEIQRNIIAKMVLGL
ncbi:MAG: acyl-CoA dehydrogenase family protein [Alphaproteobacteria bacterium]|nr:acyl-CoA dehydrogenase family protein [Alphaproteobacteria bacterium]